MRDKTGGQAIILLLLALGIFLLGAIGFAMESSLYYTNRQMSQAASDAAAQAAMTSVFARTNVDTNAFGDAPFTCDTAAADPRTPCHFARQHGFGLVGSSDSIVVEFPTSIPGVGDLSNDTPAMVSVTISRPFTTGLLQFIGASATTVRTRAVAAILIELSPVPILIMHPDDDEAFEIDGGPSITICGGPPRSIQVNSVNNASFDVSGGGSGSNLIDLSGAGPGSTLPTACDGSGGEFGNHGGPFNFSATSNGYPGGTILPTDGYIKTLPIDDPLAIPMPNDPVPPGAPITAPHPVPGGGVGAANGCQRPIGLNCTMYYPGEYNGLTIKNDMALFQPGLYYMAGGGFHIDANGIAHMAPCVTPATGFGCGMMVYNDPGNANDDITFASNAGKLQGVSYSQVLTAAGTTVICTGNCFQGPPEIAPYYGVVFMNDRSTLWEMEHNFQGGGGLTIAGTMYFTNSFLPNKSDLAGSDAYQTLELRGTPGSTTRVIGQIIVDSLILGGNAAINMTLNPNTALPIRKLALVR